MSKARVDITQSALQEWFIYDHTTGLFTWRKRPIKAPIRVGDAAGCAQRRRGGMRHILWFKGRRIYRSRAAFIYIHGDIPAHVLVDHADGDTLNDRIANLRIASTVQNTWNRMRKATAFALGVSRGERGRLKARIQLPGGKKLNIGTWGTEAEAHAAYMGAAAILHSEFWVGLRAAPAPENK